ncbi:aminotransferase class I/II-fold pyridoxal phosphate-dependent enzyme [Epibacterium sp. SM1969]|uniref:Aminotransferase class I/II-fold pyridoxal phosphate-dependent enzyme n=1 Tax=Tritonibacter aquimaris TaxID=2663379 RepID=A0A844AQ01_9RHOB|nr:aminotransferase class I/II-fold pyridoxal phosphate-dependent enzyme [Tritonibacter aquimaris]MQY42903.1 aminotransferase class I/II-fold pyridoxal phosphate-dependent enzyme [Tritonibacter aquimaris]
MQQIPNVHEAEPIPEAARAEIDALLQSGDLFRYTAPENAPVTLLEQEFAKLLGTKYALAVSSCSAALFLSLKALGLPRDARVLIPGFTFAAVPSSVIHADCVPVLCEVADNYRIDMADFEAKLDENIQAVIISHMRGHTSDMDAIMALCTARGIPVIEDAAHSLGTTWHGKNIGTIGQIGCFSFQSYKMINAGEGGILITDDADLVAQAVIMSGAYEHNWKKHKGPEGQNDPELAEAFGKWQNKLPLYNLRMSNLSAVVIRPQIPELARRVRDGLANHDYMAEKLNAETHFHVPAPLAPEQRAPDSIQFNLVGLNDAQIECFSKASAARGVKVQIFGRSDDNARAFWNWQFMGDVPELPQTRAMLMNACDVRLPVRLTRDEIDAIIAVLTAAMAETQAQAAA